MSYIEFVQIKPNSNKDINNALLENLNKTLSNNLINPSNSTWNDSIDDLSIDYEDIFINNKSNDPINFINNFFSDNKTDVDKTDIDNTIDQYYDIISFDSNFSDKIYLMLTDKNKNSSNTNNDEKKKDFNLLASTLIKFHTNSIAIFGNVFIISINREYYNMLENFNKVKEDAIKSNLNIDNIINEYTDKLNKYQYIYYNFKIKNLFESFANVYFIKVFGVTNREKKEYNLSIYSRDLLENFLKNSNIKKYLFNESNSIIKISYETIDIYAKYSQFLPNSHYNILSLIQSEKKTDNIEKIIDIENVYFINLSDSDIKFIQNKI